MLAQARESLETYLRNFDFFSPLSLDERQLLVTQAVYREFGAKEIIFLEGDPCAGLWLIVEGSIRIFKLSPDGHEHILHLLGPGDHFNDIPILDCGPNPASAAALSDVSLWHIPPDVISDLLISNPDLTYHVMGILARRVRMLIERIEDLTLRSVTARIAGYLLRESEDPSSAGVGVTRASIAAHLATTPETVSRVLRQLEAAGAIRFDRHRIIILNPGQLADYTLS